MRTALAVLVATVVCGNVVRAASQTYQEVNGVVSMEAENATERVGWTEEDITNSSGVTMEDSASRNQGWLKFSVTFTRTGNYFVWFRHMKPPGATDGSNDCYVYVDGNRLYVWEGSGTRPDGCGTHYTSLTWQSRPKTEVVDDRNKHVYYPISSTGLHEFKVQSRSQGYLLDKICLIHQNEGGNDSSPSILSGFGPAETASGGTPTPPPSNMPPTVTFATPSNGATLDEGADMYVEVNASDTDGSVASVKLDLDGALVRQENNAPYEWGADGQGDTVLENMAAGTYTLQAIATDDDGATASASITVTVAPPANLRPVADAGADLAVADDDMDDQASVTLDGTGSSDPTPGGSIASYAWSEGATQLATGATPSITLDVGVHVITLTVTDDEGATDSDTVAVTVLFQDDDGDGIADTWEIDHFGSVSVANETSDADVDGWSDLKEFLGGTDPNDIDSSPGFGGSASGVSCAAGGGDVPALALVLVGVVCMVIARGRRAGECVS